jgi:hypothetical protein
VRPTSEQAPERWALLFLVLGVPLYFPGLLAGQLPGPFAAGISDTLLFFEPYALEFTRAMRTGTNPFWSQASAFGAPTLLTLGTGALHPFQLLHLLMPDWLAFAAGWWLRIALFSGYFYAYLRLQNTRAWIALSFTLMLSYGSFFINYSYEIIGFVVAFFPMALYHATHVCRTPRTPDLVLLAVAVACLILGGFPSVILYLLLTLGAYVLVMARSRRTLALAGLSCCAGVLLVLPTIIETLSFYPATGYSLEQRKRLFFYDPPFATAFNLVIPAAFGNMHGYQKAGMRDFYGSLLGAGLLTVPLALTLTIYHTFRRRPMPKAAVFWLLIFLLSVAAYFNFFQVKQLIQHLPIIKEHPLTRLQVLIVLAGTLSAALLLEQAVRAANRQHWHAIAGLTLGLLALAYAGALWQLQGEQVAANVARYGTIAALSLFTLAWAAVSKRQLPKYLFVGSNVALGVATSLSYTYYFSPRDYYPKNELIAHIEAQLQPGARVLDLQNRLFKNTAVAYGIPSLTNHWFSPPALRAAVHRVSPHPASVGLTLDTIQSIDPVTAWEALRSMHVQFVALACADNHHWMQTTAPTGSKPDWRVLAPQHDGVCLIEVLWDGQPLSRYGALSGRGYQEYLERPGFIRLRATESTFTLPVRYDNGWKITSGDAAILRTADGWIGIQAGAAMETITLDYSPSRLAPWLLAGPLALALVVALHLRTTGSRRQPAAEEEHLQTSKS